MLRWSPRLSDRTFRRVLPCLLIVAAGLLLGLHNRWIGADWHLALDAVGALSSGLTGWWVAQTIRERRAAKRPSAVDRILFGPET